MQKPIKILIVEDEMSIALELEMLVDELGYQLIGIIDNGEEALLAAKEKLPDLILMDIDIKGEYNGLTVAEKIKDLPIAILFITSFETQAMLQKAKSTNFVGYLTKPIRKVSIEGAIEAAIRLLNNSHSLSPISYSLDTTSPFKKEDIFIERFKRQILNNLDDSSLKAAQIAQKMGISRMQLHRKIKALTNYTTSKYIQHIRLEKALELLQEQELNITEIAYQVGFTNPNHFSKLFKEKYGKVPSYFIKKGK